MKKRVARHKVWIKEAVPWAILGITGMLATYYLWGGSTPTAERGLMPTLPTAELTQTAPAFTLSDVNGKPLSLSDFKGRIVVLDFWATWCPPCKREIPDFIDLQRNFEPKGVQVVGIGLDQPEKLAAFARQYGMNYPVLVGTQEIAVKYGGIDGIPTTFIIDQSGKIVNRFEGYRPAGVFVDEVKRLMK